MIKILNQSLETLAILQNVVSPLITEEINGQFTLDFATVIDNDKSAHVNYQNIIESESNYFNIVYTEEERSQNGLFINAQCEHVSYDLLSANFTAGFTATGQFSAMATTLLAGTGFTVGTVEITASGTTSINESTNAMAALKHLAKVIFNGELEFDKYQINLLTRRGANRNVQFRYRKNLVGVKRITDNRKKVAGLPTISYQVSAAELEFEQGFITDGVSSLEHYELGDTVRTMDDDLNLDASMRIVKESHDPEQRMRGTVEISNVIEDITDTLTTIQTTTVAKDNVYNGCSIGPENGFVAERSDQLVKTSTNATNGIEIDLRNTTTASYTAVFYVQIDTATGTARLYLAGNAVFTGQVIASDIIGGTITIGTGSNTFNANGTDGIWLGYSALATAPFSVTLSGALTASAATITGVINATGGSFSGTICANGTIQGGTITGAIISAHDVLRVSSNIWEFGGGMDYGINFGGVVSGYVAPCSIRYFQGTTGADSALNILLPVGAQVYVDQNLQIDGGAVIGGLLSVGGDLSVGGGLEVDGLTVNSTYTYLANGCYLEAAADGLRIHTDATNYIHIANGVIYGYTNGVSKTLAP